MLQWMIYVIIVTVVLGAAALCAERGLRLQRMATRWVWAAAIIASLVVPTIIASVSVQVPNIASTGNPQDPIVLRNGTSLPLTEFALSSVPISYADANASLDSRLKRYWLTASVLLALLLAASGTQVYWRKRKWQSVSLRGVSVYVAPEVGPAVVGLLRPCIVVPPWVVDLPAAQQAHVLAHEKSHLAAGDPKLLTVAVCLLVFMPWNLPLWWQLKRLRRAVEVDCDARVVDGGLTVSDYGKTLLEVGHRQSGFIGTVAAMSESKSFLEQRISIMLSKPSRWWKMSTALLGAAAVCLVAVAAQVSPPNAGLVANVESSATTAKTNISANPGAMKLAAVDPAVDPAVYDGYLGHYKLAANFILTIRRDGDRLMARTTGQPEFELFPSSPMEFFATDVKAQASFEPDVQGRAAAVTWHQNNKVLHAVRIDDQTAQKIEAEVAEHEDSQTPQPGSEAAVRHLFQGLLSGKPDYDSMSPALAQTTREQLARLSAGAQFLGPIRTVDFRGVDKQGQDVYEVGHDHGITVFRISMAPNGTIKSALMQKGP